MLICSFVPANFIDSLSLEASTLSVSLWKKFSHGVTEVKMMEKMKTKRVFKNFKMGILV